VSFITDVVVTTMSSEADAIAWVNERIKAGMPHGQELRALDMSASGGRKASSARVYAAAFNWADLSDLTDALQSAPWRFPDWVTACILDEGAGFKRLTIG
jgi:hypothetical protein